MNFLLDATLGMLVIWLAVKLVSKLVEYKQWTLLTFGEYGEWKAFYLERLSLYFIKIHFRPPEGAVVPLEVSRPSPAGSAAEYVLIVFRMGLIFTPGLLLCSGDEIVINI